MLSVKVGVHHSEMRIAASMQSNFIHNLPSRFTHYGDISLLLTSWGHLFSTHHSQYIGSMGLHRQQ